MSHEETIAYIERDALHALIPQLPTTGMWHQPDEDAYLALTTHMKWAKRGPLEEDPTKKQIIPYVIVTRGDQVWAMQRQSAQREARLHGKVSLGVGGHLDEVERAHRDPILAGAMRECAEEVTLDGITFDSLHLDYVGLINDDSNEVGKVHVGVVFMLKLPAEANVRVRENDKMKGHWTTWHTLEGKPMETWSTLVAEKLAPTLAGT